MRGGRVPATPGRSARRAAAILARVAAPAVFMGGECSVWCATARLARAKKQLGAQAQGRCDMGGRGRGRARAGAGGRGRARAGAGA